MPPATLTSTCTPAKAINRVVDRRLDLLRIAKLGLDGNRSASRGNDFLDHFRGAVDFDIDDAHRGTRPGQRARDRGTNASSASRHDSSLIGEKTRVPAHMRWKVRTARTAAP